MVICTPGVLGYKVNKKGELVKKQSKTYHDGANEERSCILKKVRSEIKKAERLYGKDITWQTLCEQEAWLLERDKRYKKKAGGL